MVASLSILLNQLDDNWPWRQVAIYNMCMGREETYHVQLYLSSIQHEKNVTLFM